mmetsp:Transcript_4605/g.11710  ORF Transcript_4605/g.11710 Transcript_4605/m.11710 type:complete len:203 (-) Transcript_4605:377-985(-)
MVLLVEVRFFWFPRSSSSSSLSSSSSSSLSESSTAFDFGDSSSTLLPPPKQQARRERLVGGVSAAGDSPSERLDRRLRRKYHQMPRRTTTTTAAATPPIKATETPPPPPPPPDSWPQLSAHPDDMPSCWGATFSKIQVRYAAISVPQAASQHEYVVVYIWQTLSLTVVQNWSVPGIANACPCANFWTIDPLKSVEKFDKSTH